MRVPLMPLALSLAVGGLLYTAYEGNKRIVENAATRPAATAPAAAAPSAASTTTDRPAAGVDEAVDDVAAENLDERCTAIADLAEAAADALDSGVPLDVFLRRPEVAFVNDPALRVELEKLARTFYEAPPVSPTTARRVALRDTGCR